MNFMTPATSHIANLSSINATTLTNELQNAMNHSQQSLYYQHQQLPIDFNNDINITIAIGSEFNATTSLKTDAPAIGHPLHNLVANITATTFEYAAQWLAARTIAPTIPFTYNDSSNMASTIASNALAAATTIGAPDATAPTPSTTIVGMLSDAVDHWLLQNNASVVNATDTVNMSSSIYGTTVSNSSMDTFVGGTIFTDYYDEYAPCHPENPTFNCTREQYLEFRQGPQRLPLYKALLVTIMFGGIFITGILGNVLVCVVIVRHSTMHTATNYYLFSLAVSDLLYLLFGLPAEVFLYWHQYPYLFGLPFCKIRAFISEASTYVSVLTIVAFSMERFLAICHPLHLYAMSGFKRALRIIAVLWIVSFISAIPFGVMTDIEYEHYPLDNSKIAESAFCAMVHFPDDFPLFELSFCVFFIIPMILIIIVYVKMGAQIKSRTSQQLGVQQGSMHKESRHSKSRKAVIRMLAAVVITFFVCWLPFHMQRLWFLYAKNCENYQEINEWMFSITGFAYYVSCTINPILYNVMSHRYRVAFKDILCGKRRSVFYNNGLARDQSSFRETTIASSVPGNSTYDRVHSVRVRSTRHMNNPKDRDSSKSHSNALWLKKADFNVPIQQDITEDSQALGTNVVVVVDNSVNGRPKVYTENEAQETLINKSNETCI